MRATKSSVINYSDRISMTIPELAAALGCGRAAAEKIALDSGARFTIGKRVLVSRSKVEKYIEEALIQ